MNLNDVKMLSLSRKITNGTYGTHKAFPFFGKLSNGRLLIVFRDGADHFITGGSIKSIHSDDDGLSWSNPVDVVPFENDKDFRPDAGGVDSNGVFWLAYEELNVSTSLGCKTHIISTTDGDQWSEPFTVFDNAGGARLCPYGNPVDVGDRVLFPCRNTVNSEIRLIETTDRVNWSQRTILTPASSDFFTEISMVTDGQNVVGVGRKNYVSEQPWIISSKDKGLTWSEKRTVDNVILGRNPPTLYLDGDDLYLFHCSRGDDSMPDGGAGKLRPYYFTMTSFLDAVDGNDVWRVQEALPITGGNSADNGDHGYLRLEKNQLGMPLGVRYSGNRTNGGGCDLYLSNFTLILGL